MTRTLVALLAILVLASLACWAAASNPAVGKWALVATDDQGQQSNWTMVVREEEGKLAGSLIGDQGELPMVEPKLTGKTFTFKVMINEQAYTAETRIDGNKLDGKYKGPEASGTLKATKQ